MITVSDDIMKAAREAAADHYEKIGWKPGQVAEMRLGAYDNMGAVQAAARAIQTERKRAAMIGYAVCVFTRHVSLGEQVREAIEKGEIPKGDQP